MITVTRRYGFAASHRLHIRSLTEEQNFEIFGKCNNPFGHGHNYVLGVTVSGVPDEVTGLLFPIKALDDFVERYVLSFFRHRNMNADLPQFADSPPTTENVTVVIGDLLQTHWPEATLPEGVRLHSIQVQETERNGFELLVGSEREQRTANRSREEDLIHV